MVSTVGIALKATGVGEINSALKSVKESLMDIGKATTAQANLFKNASKEKISALKAEEAAIKAVSAATREQARLEQELTRASGRGVGGGNRGVSDSIRSYGLFGHGFMGAARASYLGAQGGGGFGGAVGGLGLNLAFQALSSAVDIATTSLKMFGSFLVNDIIKPGMELETRSIQLANRTHETTPEAIQKAAKLNRIKYNMSYEDSLGVIEEYGAKGGEHSWKDAPAVSEFVAQYHKATGFDAKKIAELLGGIRSRGESSEDVISKFLAIEPAMGINVDPEHMAALGRRAKTVGAMFAGSNVTQMSEANALLQLASVGTGSPAIAATGMTSFFKKIVSDPKVHSHFKKFLTMQDGREVIKDPFELMRFVAEKEKGKMVNLTGLGLKDQRAAMNFIAPLESTLPTFRKQAQVEGLKGREAEKRALDLWVQSLRDAQGAVKDRAQVEEDAAKAMATSQEKWNQAINQMKDMVSEQIMPATQKFVDGIVNNKELLVDAMMELTRAFVWLGEATLSTIKDFEDMDVGVDRVKLALSKDGDVVRTILNMGDKTNFREDIFSNDKGYWRTKDKNHYEFVTGKPPEGIGEFGRVGSKGTLVLGPESTAIKEEPFVFGQGKGMPRPDLGPPGFNSVISPDVQLNKESPEQAKQSLDDFTKALKGATDALNKMNGLNRTAPPGARDMR